MPQLTTTFKAKIRYEGGDACSVRTGGGEDTSDEDSTLAGHLAVFADAYAAATGGGPGWLTLLRAAAWCDGVPPDVCDALRAMAERHESGGKGDLA